MRRFSYKTLLWVAFPALDRDARRRPWVESKEHLDDLSEQPSWLGIGFATAEGGGLLLLIALILGGIGLRRSRSGGGNGLLKASGVIATRAGRRLRRRRLGDGRQADVARRAHQSVGR